MVNKDVKQTTAFGAPVWDDNNVITAGPRGPVLLQSTWFLEKLAAFDRERILKGWCMLKEAELMALSP